MFYVFFLFNLPDAGMFKKQKDRFVLDVTEAKEIQNLHPWSFMDKAKTW